MQRTRTRARALAAAMTAIGAAFLLPTALSAHADTTAVSTTTTSLTTLNMGDVTTTGDAVQLSPMATDVQPPNVPPTNPPCDSDHGVPLIHSRVCQSPRPGDKEDGNHHCDGDNDSDDMHCPPSGSPPPTSSPSSTPSGTPSSTPSGGSEDVCETGGLLGPETIADQLVDAGVPLNEPEDNGPISGPVEQALSPLDPISAEVTCAINLLGL